jgi:hypothetical protein
MSIIDNFQNMFSVAGQKARKTYDIKILIHKIKDYEKELKDCYVTVGKALHSSRKEDISLDEALIAATFENIDTLAYRINLLSRQIDQIRKQETTTKGQRRESAYQDAVVPPSAEAIEEKYAKLSMKEDDLKIRRTVEGIKAVRVCPACSCSNDPAAETCSGCGAVLRGNHE